MAERYWVGGSGVWSNTSNWASTSGGVGGASVPTNIDSVFIEQNGPYTISLDVAANVLDFEVLGTNVSFDGINSLLLKGNFFLEATTTLSVGSVSVSPSVSGTVSINTNNVLLPSLNIQPSASSSNTIISFESACRCSAYLSVSPTGATRTIINTNGYSITAYNIDCTTSLRTVVFNLGSSYITARWFVGGQYVSVNAGLSTIYFPLSGSATASFGASSVYKYQYHNVVIAPTGAADLSYITVNMKGCNNLTLNNIAGFASSRAYYFINDHIYVNGTFTALGSDASNRVQIMAGLTQFGCRSNISIGKQANVADVDFQDIGIGGPVAPISGTRIGDLRGCKNITFSSPKTVYWVGGSGNWTDVSHWSLTTGGTSTINAFPLPQDTSVFDTNAGAGTITIYSDLTCPHYGSINTIARGNPYTTIFSWDTRGTSSIYWGIYGDLTLDAYYTNVVYPNTVPYVALCGRQNQNISGEILGGGFPVVIISPGGKVTLQSAIDCSGVTLSAGEFDTNGYALNMGFLSVTSSPVSGFVKPYIYTYLYFSKKFRARSSVISLTSNGGILNLVSEKEGAVVYDFGTSTIEIVGSLTSTAVYGKYRKDKIRFYNFVFHPYSSPPQQYDELPGSSQQRVLPGGIFNNLTFDVTRGSDNTTTRFHMLGDVIVEGTIQTVGTTMTKRVALLAHHTYRTSQPTNTTWRLPINAAAANLAYCDCMALELTGAAANTTVVGGGNMMNNVGFVFPSPKTVYWNGSNTEWSTGWAATSGGVPSVNNYPLAQDTCIINNAGNNNIYSNASIRIVGTIDSTARTTTRLDLQTTTVYITGNFYGGNTQWNGLANTFTIFAGNGTQTITSTNPYGVGLGDSIAILGDSTVLFNTAVNTSKIAIYTGTLQATANVRARSLQMSATTSSLLGPTLKMGNGTWSFTVAGLYLSSVWSVTTAFGLYPYYVANEAQQERGGEESYDVMFVRPKILREGASVVLDCDVNDANATIAIDSNFCFPPLTIQGTGTNTTVTLSTSSSNSTTYPIFDSITCRRSVPSTIALSTSYIKVGKLDVSGANSSSMLTIRTALAGVQTNMYINGDPQSNVDYINVSNVSISVASPTAWYVGPNSNNISAVTANVFFQSAPAPRTLYWVGSNGSFWDGTHWSLTSGGSAIGSSPTSADNLIFDANSSAAAYTVTTTGGNTRCNSVTVNPPATGNVTIGGSGGVFAHGNVWFASANVTLNFYGPLVLSGSGNSIITTGDRTSNAQLQIDGYNSNWVLSGNFDNTRNTTSGGIVIRAGTFNTNGFSVATRTINAAPEHSVRRLVLGNSAISANQLLFNGANTSYAYDYALASPFSIDAGTSTITLNYNTATTHSFDGATLYNLIITGTADTHRFIGDVVVNDLTINRGARYAKVVLRGDLTVNNALYIPDYGGTTNPSYRVLFEGWRPSNKKHTLSVRQLGGSVSDVDFKNLNVTGNATPLAITRAGDCGDVATGVAFSTPKTVYFNSSSLTTVDWNSNVWAPTSGGTPDITYFPLGQDTIIIDDVPTANLQITANYAIGTFDATPRSLPLTFTVATLTTPSVYHDWKLGTGIAFATTTGTLQFEGNTTQYVAANGVTIPYSIAVLQSNTGTVTLLNDLLLQNKDITLYTGTLNANASNVVARNVQITTGVTGTTYLYRGATLKMGAGTWLVANSWITPNSDFASISACTSILDIGNGAPIYATLASNGYSYNTIKLSGILRGNSHYITMLGGVNNIINNKTIPYSIVLTGVAVANNISGGVRGNPMTIRGSVSSATIFATSSKVVDFVRAYGVAFSTPYGSQWVGNTDVGASSTSGLDYTLNTSATLDNMFLTL